MGKALERAIDGGGGEEEVTKKRKRAPLMSRMRRRLFEHMCRHPASHLTPMAHAVGQSLHSVKWHVDKMEEGGYVNVHGSGKKAVYLPVGMIAVEDVELIELLGTRDGGRIYAHVARNPGISQKELMLDLKISGSHAGQLAAQMVDMGVLNVTEDGRFRRYYPTPLIQQKRDEYYKRMSAFRENLLSKLEADGLHPRAMRSVNTELIVEISTRGAKEVLRIATDPWTTVFSERAFG